MLASSSEAFSPCHSSVPRMVFLTLSSRVRIWTHFSWIQSRLCVGGSSPPRINTAIQQQTLMRSSYVPETVPCAGGTATNKADNILVLLQLTSWRESHDQRSISVMANGRSDRRKLTQRGSDRHCSVIRTASQASPGGAP